ncbi:hypothetical protein PFISCL1PPCAC_5025, partial [Pristionchus fissidentatus]
MDPKDNKPATPSTPAKKESEFLEGDDCRTADETESLTDARVSRAPAPPADNLTPRDAWANVAPSSQPRIVPATQKSQADRDAEEIVSSTQRALQTLRNSSDPRNRSFVPPSQQAPDTTPKRGARSPFRPFSGQGQSLNTPIGVRTAVAASPAVQQTSVRTATARSPDVRTGLENSGRSATESRQRSRIAAAAKSSNSSVRTALTPGKSSKKSKQSRKSGCSTVHTATTNYEIDLRPPRKNSMTAPATAGVATARSVSPASRPARSPARVVSQQTPSRPNANQQLPYYDPDYLPLPSEGDPTEQVVELVDQQKLAQEYQPHVSRPILFGTGVSGIRTARAHSPVRTRTLSERTALGDTSLKTSRSPGNKSEKSRSGRNDNASSVHSLATTVTARSFKTDRWSPESSQRSKRASQKPNRSQSQSFLNTTSARSYQTDKSWATPNKTPCRKNLRSAQKSASE